jgi:hypothetical protein
MTGSAAAVAAAAAAAARARRQEEEEMTAYTNEDLVQGFEFKILRANTNAFRKPEVLRLALEEEARAGWTLVEKFDDARVRLKRPANAKQNDSSLTVDPYRSVYGLGQGALAAMIVGSIAAVLIVVAIVVTALR